MDLGVALGWINISLLAIAGIFANFRWKHLGFFPVYALTLSVLGFLGLIWWYNYDFSLIRSNIGNLLCLLAVAEVWRVEFKRSQWWFIIALMPMVIIPFLSLDYTLAYQLPQASLTIVLVLLLPIAFKRRNAILIGWGINGFVAIFADIAAYMWPAASWPIIRFVYPAAFLAMNGIWLWKLLEPERAKLAEFLARFMPGAELAPQAAGNGRLGRHAPDEVEAALQSGIAESALGAEIYEFPRGISEPDDFELPEDTEVGGTLEEINLRLESIETAMDTVAKLAMEKNKIFLSRPELALYLGVSENVADKFIKHNRIKTIPLTGDANDWVVLFNDVNEAIGIAD